MNAFHQLLAQELIEILKQHLEQASVGHCMRISGLPNEILHTVCQELQGKAGYRVVLLANHPQKSYEVSATKLIELRNEAEQKHVLLVLLPSNLRTGAEDSFDRATFGELEIEDLPRKVLKKLETVLKPEEKDIYRKIARFFHDSKNFLNDSQFIEYLLACQQDGFEQAAWGNNLPLLGLIPDSELLLHPEQLGQRLFQNQKSITLLSNESMPLIQRIKLLEIESNSIQNQLYHFLNQQRTPEFPKTWTSLIQEEIPELNLKSWPFTSMRSLEELQVDLEPLKGQAVKKDENGKFIATQTDKDIKFSIGFRTTPGPAEVSSLTHFQIDLMRINEDGFPECVDTLVKFKKSTGRDNKRNKQITLDPRRIAEGVYYFRVLALDESSTLLNRKDPFQDEELEDLWQKRLKSEGENARRDDLNGKLSCDSEDFYFAIEKSDDEKIEGELSSTFSRRTKAETFSQAKMKARLDYINGNRLKDLSSLTLETCNWTDQGQGSKQSCDADIYFNDVRHHYMMPMARSLREISWEILRNSDDFSSVKVDFCTQIKEIKGKPILLPSELDTGEFSELLAYRQELFQAILDQVKPENVQSQGIVELFDFIQHEKLVERYITEYLLKLSNILHESQTVQDEKNLQKIREFLYLDLIEVRIPIQNSHKKTVYLLPPIHPLRLVWNLQHNRLFHEWEKLSLEESSPKSKWTDEIKSIFLGELQPALNPLVLPGKNFKSLVYMGSLIPGWGVYAPVIKEKQKEYLSSQSLLNAIRQNLQLPVSTEPEHEIPIDLLVKQLKRYIKGHPYIECLYLNFFNSGNGQKIVDCLKRLQKEAEYSHLRYEIRIVSTAQIGVDTGQALADFLNPSGYISEESEAFIKAVPNALFPKIRYSLNSLADYQQKPELFPAHMSFVFDSFPVNVKLVKPNQEKTPSLFLHGLICKPVRKIQTENPGSFQWDLVINANSCRPINREDSLSNKISQLFSQFQQMTSILLAGKWTETQPGLSLQLSDQDHAFLNTVHQYSDWVMTFDRNLGIEMYDSPSASEGIPYLLDFKPEMKPGYPSVYLTTRPTSEISAIVKPAFLNMDWQNRMELIPPFLEVLRSISGTLIMQLAGGGNKGLESIGLGLSRLLLEKLHLLDEYILVPLDLHQDLFQIAQQNSEEERSLQRGDLLMVSCNPAKRILHMRILEIKCRAHLQEQSLQELQDKMCEQINETMTCLQFHFDPRLHPTDRLDRSLKNQQLYELLGFYLERAHRYHLIDQSYHEMRTFIESLEDGFQFQFHKNGIIFEYGSERRELSTYSPQIDIQLFHVGSPMIETLLNELSQPKTSERILDKETEEIYHTMTLRPKYQEKANPVISGKNADPKIKYSNIDQPKEQFTTNKMSDPQEIEDSYQTSKNVEKEVPAINENISPSEVCDPNKSISSRVIIEKPDYTDLLGVEEGQDSEQFGLLATTSRGRKVALDLNGCNTISLFGVPGSGKSYTLGTIVEMATQPINGINCLPSPLASVIFHFHESQDYPPEFLSMRYPNKNLSQTEILLKEFGAQPEALHDIVLLVPIDKLQERRAEYPDITIAPIAFSSQELNIKDWKFLMGAMGNQAMYMQTINMIMRQGRNQLTLDFLQQGIENSALSTHLKDFALHRLELASQFIDDTTNLRQYLKPGRLILVDLRDEFIEKDQALGLFVVMLNIFAGAKNDDGSNFNKLIVFDEAHKYISNSDLTTHVVDVIRQMRHQGVTMLLASQDPPSLPIEVIELSSAVVLHRFNSPQWLKHIQKANTSLQDLTPDQLANLQSGEAFIWADKASNTEWRKKAIKVVTRPRATQHGGGTQQAVQN
jgi:DNA phosphorothioation-dependent restriction protein DptH